MRLSIPVILFLLLTGCARYSQIYYAMPRDGATSQHQSFYVYENDSIRVAYSFWDAKGAMSFMIYNKMNVPMYIDWKRSSFVGKGEKKNYYEDIKVHRAITVGVTEGREVSLAARFRPLYSTWYTPATVSASQSAMVGITEGVELKPERVSFIPPNSHVYKSADFDFIGGPIKTNKDSTHDAIVNGIKCKERILSPQVATNIFRNFFTYSTTESFASEHYVDNTFYLGRILTVNTKKAVGKAYYDNKGVRTFVSPFMSPDRFFIHNLYISDVQ